MECPQQSIDTQSASTAQSGGDAVVEGGAVAGVVGAVVFAGEQESASATRSRRNIVPDCREVVSTR